MIPRKINALGVSRDTLNPLLNHENLRTRLQTIEHYKYLNGVRYARWPHFWMQATAKSMNRYKYNIAIKAFLVYVLYKDVDAFRYYRFSQVRTYQNDLYYGLPILAKTAVLGATCFLI